MSLRKNILIIDNNSHHFNLLRQILADASMNVTLTRALDISKGKKLLNSHRFDLILTENHESVSEENWLAHIKKNSHGASVVILTSISDEKKAIAAMKNGADDYIIKSRESIKNLPEILTKNLQKKKNSPSLKPAPIQGGMDLLSRNLKTIAELINQPSKTITKGKEQIQILEKEIDRLKGMLKNFVS